MIHSASNSPSQPGGIPPAAPRTAPAGPARSVASARDTLDTSASTGLKAALAALPEVRPEVVEKARALAIDPNYPPRTIIEDIARLMVNTPDPTNQA